MREWDGRRARLGKPEHRPWQGRFYGQVDNPTQHSIAWARVQTRTSQFAPRNKRDDAAAAAAAHMGTRDGVAVFGKVVRVRVLYCTFFLLRIRIEYIRNLSMYCTASPASPEAMRACGTKRETNETRKKNTVRHLPVARGEVRCLRGQTGQEHARTQPISPSPSHLPVRKVRASVRPRKASAVRTVTMAMGSAASHPLFPPLSRSRRVAICKYSTVPKSSQTQFNVRQQTEFTVRVAFPCAGLAPRATRPRPKRQKAKGERRKAKKAKRQKGKRAKREHPR